MSRALPVFAANLGSSRPLGESLSESLRKGIGQIARAYAWIHANKTTRLSSRRLHVIETVSLGEKRFVAVLQIDKQQFLVSSGPTGVALLASLDSAKSFVDVFKESRGTPKIPSKPCTRKPKKPVRGDA